MKEIATRLSKAELQTRAAFRRQLRLFERFGEECAQAQGITLAQYQLLLQVEAMPGRRWAHVGELAQALIQRHHTTVEMLDRCELAGLVHRTRSSDDQRKVRVSLTALGRRRLHAVALLHGSEIANLLDVVSAAASGQAAQQDPLDG